MTDPLPVLVVGKKNTLFTLIIYPGKLSTFSDENMYHLQYNPWCTVLTHFRNVSIFVPNSSSILYKHMQMPTLKTSNFLELAYLVILPTEYNLET